MTKCIDTLFQHESHSKIPRIDSIQGFDPFWDTHDLTDFEDGFGKEVTEPIFTGEPSGEPAISQGMQPTGLIHEWSAEKTGLYHRRVR